MREMTETVDRNPHSVPAAVCINMAHPAPTPSKHSDAAESHSPEIFILDPASDAGRNGVRRYASQRAIHDRLLSCIGDILIVT